MAKSKIYERRVFGSNGIRTHLNTLRYPRSAPPRFRTIGKSGAAAPTVGRWRPVGRAKFRPVRRPPDVPRLALRPDHGEPPAPIGANSPATAPCRPQGHRPLGCHRAVSPARRATDMRETR